jgi:hypothetical protein
MKRTTVGHVNDPHDVYIGRPSKFGNPFVVGVDGDRDEVIAKHAEWIYTQPELMAAIKTELQGKRLACWCRPKKKSCHGDILAWIADMDDIFGE